MHGVNLHLFVSKMSSVEARINIKSARYPENLIWGKTNWWFENNLKLKSNFGKPQTQLSRPI